MNLNTYLTGIVILMIQVNTVKCFRGGKYISHTDVSLLMKQPLTQQYIAGFNNSFQRLVITKQLEGCPYMPLCNFTFGLYSGIISCCKKCECNFPQCMLRQTCCPDVIFHNLDITGDMLVKGSDLKSLTGVESQKSCITLLLSKNMFYNIKGTGVLGYATCPSGTSDQLAWNCSKSYINEVETFEDITPVVSKLSNDVYRNKYCAYCHNIKNDNFQFLRKKFLCKSVPTAGLERTLIEEVLSTGTCDLQFVSENVLDTCTVAINKCNITGQWNVYNPQIENACNLYKSIFENEEEDVTKYFKNIFCSECNGFGRSSLHCELNGHTEGIGGFSFSGLLKQERTQQPIALSKQNGRCSGDEVYDTLSVFTKFLV